MNHSRVLTLFVFLIVLTQTWSQIQFEVPEANATLPITNEVLPPSKLNVGHTLEVCNVNDNVSNKYCKCNDRIVNCDFTDFPAQETSNSMEYTISGYDFPDDTSRACFCNTPENLTIVFGKEFLPRRNKIYRFDLYNLQGDTELDGGFALNFNGDLYLANLRRIPEIHSYEFRRGYDGKIPNLQELRCCSQINVNQGLKKPLLYIENTTIDSIKTGGISDDHLWKTIIFKTVTVNEVLKNGISLYNTEDIAIIDSTFDTVSNYGIHFQRASNLFIAKTYFKLDTSYLAWSSRSTSNDSNVVLLANKFWNGILLSVDAKRIVSWHNLFLIWDSDTFSYNMQHSSFNERFISIKYNVVNVVETLTPHSFQFGNGSQVTLKENVLGTCNCSLYLLEDPFIKGEVNRCFVGNITDISSGKCSLRLDAVAKACKQSTAPNFIEMCHDKSIATNSLFPGIGTDVMQGAEKARVNSTFITSIIHDYSQLIGVNKIASVDGFLEDSKTIVQDEESDMNKNEHNNPGGNTDHRNSSTQSDSTAMTVVITLTVLVILTVVVLISYRNRHRFFGRNHQRLDGSREIFI